VILFTGLQARFSSPSGAIFTSELHEYPRLLMPANKKVTIVTRAPNGVVVKDRAWAAIPLALAARRHVDADTRPPHQTLVEQAFEFSE